MLEQFGTYLDTFLATDRAKLAAIIVFCLALYGLINAWLNKQFEKWERERREMLASARRAEGGQQ